MKKPIEIVSKHKIRFYKTVWSEDDIFLAHCLDMTVEEGYVVCDIRITYKKALGGFVKKVFPVIFMRDRGFIAEFFTNIKRMYEDDFNDFLEKYKERLDYSKVGKKLRHYQLETIYRCIHSKSKLLALDMGTGKTLTSATISKVISAPRTCIIGPALVKWNWYEDMVSWGYNNLYWTILEALKHKSMFAIKERFIVLNYEVVEKYKSEINKASIDSFIIDECHKIKNTTTKAFKSVYNLTKQHPKAKVILLSGTPWTNRVTDLFAYLKVAGHPLGVNKKKFEDMYAVKNGTKIIGTKNIDDLKLKISNFMIRLKSDDVLELPRLSIHKTYFNIGELNDDYNKVLNELQGIRDEYDKAEEDKKKEFNLKAKIRQSISSLSRITSMSKIPQVVQWVNSMVEQNEKVIIFSSWRGVLEELEKCFGASNCVRVDGSVESKKRQELVNKFNDEKSGVDIFLGQVKAAGVGINLVSSRTVVLMDVPISPDLIEQPIKRSHRSGQKRPVNAYFTFAKGTIDERLYSLIQEKAGDINAIIDADTKKGVVKYDEIPEMLFKELTVNHSNTTSDVSIKQGMVNKSNLVIK